MLAMAFTQSFAQQKGSFTDARDNKTYKTVKIGKQTWMAENLNYNAKDSKCYDNKEDNCRKYGRLYNYKPENAKNVCPAGWHLPSVIEWETLFDFAGGWQNAEKNLKAKSGWNDDWDFSSNKRMSGNGEDKFGFTALPGGTYGHSDECGEDDECYGFRFAGGCGLFIRSEVGLNSDKDYYCKYISDCKICNGEVFSHWRYYKPILLSVRCVQDNAEWAKAEAEERRVADSITVAKTEAKAKKEKKKKNNSGNFIDSRDNKKYKTIKIGNQTWMAENLNYNASSSRCYEDDPSYCKKYGKLYNLEAAMKACPKGWHLPSKDEWEILEVSVGETLVAGKYLKAKEGWNESGNGEDTYGFTALPGGYGDSDGSFSNVGYNGYWWSSREGSSSDADYRGMDYDDEGAYWVNYDKSSLYSVRCAQD
jgi:uncharacterized protein (TIGR02145 family)